MTVRSDHYALLVGIDYYPGLRDGLEGAERDATMFASWLRQPDGGGVPDKNICSLVTSKYGRPERSRDAKPAMQDFHNELVDLVINPVTRKFHERRGRLYLFLSGHGFGSTGADEAALYSADAQTPGFQHIPATRYALWAQRQGVYEEIVLIMDSCRTISGARTIAQPSLLDMPNPNAVQDVRLLQWYAAPGGAKAKEEADESGVVRGVFSRVLIEALSKAAPDDAGRVTASRVRDYVHQKWPQAREGYEIPQLPVDTAREIVFATRAIVPASTGTAMEAGQHTLIPVRICAADSATEVFLVDSELIRIGKAVGELEARVAPGDYTVRYRSGLTMVDEPLDIPDRLPKAKREIVVSGKPVEFETPIPLPHTSTHREYHADAWVRSARAPGLKMGSGGSLFVLARDTDKVPGTSTSHRPWRGLSLCNSDGSELLGFEDAPVRDEDLGYAAARIELDPGTYFLRVSGSDVDGALEMPVYVAKGWQTQVFLASRSESRRRPAASERGDEVTTRVRSARRPDLANAAVLLVRPNRRIDPDSPALRLTELARLGLAEGRTNIRREDLERMVVSDASNPMFGILGAHVLLSGGATDPGLLKGVVDALSAMMPDHPDVRALQLAVGGSPAGAEFTFPPMVLAGWQQVVKASATSPAIVAAESFSAKVAGGVLPGGPWLLWRRTPALVAALRRVTRSLAEKAAAPQPALVATATTDATRGLSELAGLSEFGVGEPVVPVKNLTPAQFDLLNAVDSSMRRGQQPTTEELVDALGVPVATVADLVDGLRTDG